MEAKGMNGELSVEEIIERVLIRGGQQGRGYLARMQHSLTSQQHLWHFKLQQENLQLREKVKTLGLQLRKKTEAREKCLALHKEIHALRVELDGVARSNKQLQDEINQMRLRNSTINDSIQHSLDDSLRARKHNRSCSCLSNHLPSKPATNHHKKDHIRISGSPASPERQILRTRKEVSVMCLMPYQQDGTEDKLAQKQKHLKALRNIVENQEKLLAAYRREIEGKKTKAQLSKNKTMESTERLAYPFERTASHNTFKPQSSAGSIVKVRRG